jgi:hypothetical protein
MRGSASFRFFMKESRWHMSSARAHRGELRMHETFIRRLGLTIEEALDLLPSPLVHGT